MSILIAAAEVGAKAVEVSGGMSLISSEVITALLTGIAGIVSTALVYFKMKAKSDVTKIRRPLDHDDVYVTHGECCQFRKGLEKRIDEFGPALNRIFVKLNENDRKSEERSIRLHDRIEPVIQRVAANSAVIEILKQERVKDEKRGA